VGQTVLQDDADFLNQIRSLLPNAAIYLTGDVARFSPADALRKIESADGVLLDFCSSGLRDRLRDDDSPHVILRNSHKNHPLTDLGNDHIEFPVPWTGFIQKYPYRLPFFKDPKYYSITASFGCPYSCRYCNTHLLGYKTRPIDHFIEELRFASRLGYRSLYIRDATFFHDRKLAVRLLDSWDKSGSGFQWICFTRPDLVDDELAYQSARLGCTMMMMGVESFDESCLTELSRKIPITDVKETFRLLRKHRIRSTAQIILGIQDYNNTNNIITDNYEEKLKCFLNEIVSKAGRSGFYLVEHLPPASRD